MATSLERLARLKREVEEQRREADKAQGALDRVLSELKRDFGCSSLRKARKLLRRFEAGVKSGEREFNRSLARVERKWDRVKP